MIQDARRVLTTGTAVVAAASADVETRGRIVRDYIAARVESARAVLGRDGEIEGQDEPVELASGGFTLLDLIEEVFGLALESAQSCGAKTRAGTPCRYVAGYKTDHVGQGRCRLHGGATPIKHGRRSTIKRTLRDLIGQESYDELARELGDDVRSLPAG